MMFREFLVAAVFVFVFGFSVAQGVTENASQPTLRDETPGSVKPTQGSGSVKPTQGSGSVKPTQRGVTVNVVQPTVLGLTTKTPHPSAQETPVRGIPVRGIPVRGTQADSAQPWPRSGVQNQASQISRAQGSAAQNSSLQPPFAQANPDDARVYQRSLAKLEALVSGGAHVTDNVFRGFNWVGRTAAINYVCSIQEDAQCRRLLSMGLVDRALVVRDHALRVVLASGGFLPEEKSQVARGILEDPRNYRSGEPMWIVQRARKYLEGFKG